MKEIILNQTGINLHDYKLIDEANKKEYNQIEKRLLLFGATSFEEMRRITNEKKDLEIIEELERLSMDDYFRYMYNEKEVNERLMNSRYQEGIDDGISQGISQGISRGIEQGELMRLIIYNKYEKECDR